MPFPWLFHFVGLAYIAEADSSNSKRDSLKANDTVFYGLPDWRTIASFINLMQLKC